MEILKILDFGKNFRKISILVKIFKIYDVGQFFMTISILIEVFEKYRFFVKISQTFDFGQYV